MTQPKREHPKEKFELHSRNRHRERYNFKELVQTLPDLKPFVFVNKYDDESIDFANPNAVKMLNKALLKHYYDIQTWDIPENYLCPPIPGRADYVHYIAQLLSKSNNGVIPTGKSISCLDIGVGANCVYPIIGVKEYGWSFLGTDIDTVAINSAQAIVDANECLQTNVTCKLQLNPEEFFYGIIKRDECVDVTICNPPFHSSFEEAQASNIRKQSNLQKKRVEKANLNFGGQQGELWCPGGEERFIRDMIYESKQFANQCLWFTSLVSKQYNLNNIFQELDNAHVAEVKTIHMGQGNKISRIIAWTFLSKQEQTAWVSRRWK